MKTKRNAPCATALDMYATRVAAINRFFIIVYEHGSWAINPAYLFLTSVDVADQHIPRRGGGDCVSRSVRLRLTHPKLTA